MAKKRQTADPRILPQGAIIEFSGRGGYVKVAAVDPVSLMEVSIVGDPKAGEAALTSTVVRKLERMVARKRGIAPPGARTRREDPPSGWDF